MIAQFQEKHPDAESSLKSWLQALENNAFRHFVDLRKTLGSADPVPPYTVFNIAGNKYRLIAMVNYGVSVVQVTNVMTHAEYAKGRWRKQK